MPPFLGDTEITILATFSVLWHLKQIRQIHWTKQHRSQSLRIIQKWAIWEFSQIFIISFVARIFLDKSKTKAYTNMSKL